MENLSEQNSFHVWYLSYFSPSNSNGLTTNSIILGVFSIRDKGNIQYSTALYSTIHFNLFHSCSCHDVTWRDVTWSDMTWRDVIKLEHSRLLLLLFLIDCTVFIFSFHTQSIPAVLWFDLACWWGTKTKRNNTHYYCIGRASDPMSLLWDGLPKAKSRRVSVDSFITFKQKPVQTV